jgi:hypothetical protein
VLLRPHAVQLEEVYTIWLADSKKWNDCLNVSDGTIATQGTSKVHQRYRLPRVTVALALEQMARPFPHRQYPYNMGNARKCERLKVTDVIVGECGVEIVCVSASLWRINCLFNGRKAFKIFT